MRDIKFRGQNGNGEWVYGDIIQNYTTGDAFMLPFNEMDIANYVEVASSTIGQYIGLKDKNGKEIYEGDVLSAGHFKPLIIGFCKESAMFGGCTDQSMEVNKMYWFYNDIVLEQDDWYIIGNIYGNPDLIPQTT